MSFNRRDYNRLKLYFNSLIIQNVFVCQFYFPSDLNIFAIQRFFCSILGWT